MKKKTIDRNKFLIKEKLSNNLYLTPEGYLICRNVAIARDGVLLYHKSELPMKTKNADSEGMVRVYRAEKEIKDPKALASFEGKPVTMGHPPDFITPENWKKFAIGTVQNVSLGDDHKIKADLILTDPDAIEKVKSKKIRELSCGYDADYSEENGKVTQGNILGNHVALVLEGRCGSSCRIFDSKFNPKEKMAMEEMKKFLEGLRDYVDEALKKFSAEDEDTEDEEEMTDEESEDEDTEDEESEDEEEMKDEESEDEESEDEDTEDEEEMTDEESEDEDTEDEESEDECSEDEEVSDKCKDAAFLPRSVKSSIEIFAPGIQSRTKDADFCLNAALLGAIKDPDTKDLMRSLSKQSKKPMTSMNRFTRGFILDTAAKMKKQKVRTTHAVDSAIKPSSVVDAKKLNEINAKFYK